MQPPFPVPIAPPTCARCHQAFSACICGTTPARDDLQAMPKPRTFVKMGMDMVCSSCRLNVRYCRCGELPTADEGSKDGAASSLGQRIKECGGR